MGGKTKLIKYLKPILLKDRKPNQVYVEPFCGGLGSMSEIHGERIAGDFNKHLIAMWDGLKYDKVRRTKIPKAMFLAAKEEYKNNTNINFTDFQIGWIGAIASFRGRMFGGYGETDKQGRNYMQENVRILRNQQKNLHSIKFYHCNYWQLPIPPKSIIYCDPPYEGTDGYLDGEFDHKKFWDWVRRKSMEGHQVFVSEYNAPKGFLEVWKMPMTNRINHTNTEARLEKLFVYKKTWKRKKKIEIPKLF